MSHTRQPFDLALAGVRQSHQVREYAVAGWRAVLTEREADVLRCFSAGCSYRHVADALRISMSTVRTYAESLREKFCVRTTRDLVGMPVSSDAHASEFV